MSRVKQAIDLIKAGDKDAARLILIEMLQADRNDPRAWAMMVQVAEDDTEKRQSLKQLLKLKPGDEWAQRQLDQIVARQRAAEAESQPPTPQPEPAAPPPQPEPTPAPPSPPRPAQPQTPPATLQGDAADYVRAILSTDLSVVVAGEDTPARRAVLEALAREIPNDQHRIRLDTVRNKPGLTSGPPRYVMVDVPDAENWALLEMLDDGVARSLVAVDAASPQGVVNQFQVLSVAAGAVTSARQVHEKFANAFHVIAMAGTLSSGEVGITEVAEVQGTEAGTAKIVPIFQMRGGSVQPTGERPLSLQIIQQAGIPLQADIFGAPPAQTPQPDAPSDEFSWLTSEGDDATPPQPGPASGVGTEMSWLEGIDEPPPSTSDDSLAWLRGDDTEMDTSTEPAASSGGMGDLSWLAGGESEPANSEPTPASGGGDMSDLSWLTGDSEPAATTEDPSLDEPDMSWLTGGGEDAGPTTQPGAAADEEDLSWLTGGSTEAPSSTPPAEAEASEDFSDMLDIFDSTPLPKPETSAPPSSMPDLDSDTRPATGESSAPASDWESLLGESEAAAPAQRPRREAPPAQDDSWRVLPDSSSDAGAMKTPPPIQRTVPADAEQTTVRERRRKPVPAAAPPADDLTALTEEDEEEGETRNFTLVVLLGLLLVVMCLALAAAFVFQDELLGLLGSAIFPAPITASELGVESPFVPSRTAGIQVGASSEGAIAGYFEVHDYVLEGSAGQEVTITANGIGEFDDPRLQVYGPSGALLAENDDVDFGAGNLNAQVSLTLPEEGFYLIRVSMFAGETYTLDIQ